MLKRIKLTSVFIGVLSVLSASAVMAKPAQEVKTLLDSGKAAEAYAVGRAAPEQLGDPEFDFFYGIAGIDGGHPGEGVLSLERYILTYPENRSARFHLARGYFMLGEDQRAQDEFEQLLPAATGNEKNSVTAFLDAIRSRETRYKPSTLTYAEIGLGMDSNINSGLAGGSTPTIPGLGTLAPLDGNAVSAREGDTFRTLGAGIHANWPIRPGFSAFGSAALDTRSHFGNDNDIFDQMNLGLSGGVAVINDDILYRAGGNYGQVSVDNQRYVDAVGVFGELTRIINPTNRVTLGAQLSRLSYQTMSVFQTRDKSTPAISSDNSVRDADVVGINASWTHLYANPYQPAISLGVSLADEQNRNSRDDLSKLTTGLRLGVTLVPAPRWGAGANISYQDVRYQDVFMAGSSARNDAAWSLDLDLNYQWAKNISLRGSYGYVDQASNVGLYKYDRETLAVKLRYAFE